MTVNDQLDDFASIYDVDDELSKFFPSMDLAFSSSNFTPVLSTEVPITDSSGQVVSVTVNVKPDHEVFLIASFSINNPSGGAVAVGIGSTRVGSLMAIDDYECQVDLGGDQGASFSVFARDTGGRGSETYYAHAKRNISFTNGTVSNTTLIAMTFRTS